MNSGRTILSFILLLTLAINVFADDVESDIDFSSTGYVTVDTSTGIMNIPAIEVLNKSEKIIAYEAKLKTVNEDFSAFELLNVTLLEGDINTLRASYDPDTITANLSGVYVLENAEIKVFNETVLYDQEKDQYVISQKTQLPYFPGIPSLTLVDKKTIMATWLPVTSSIDADNISYEIHLSQDADFIPNEDTLYATVDNTTEYKLTKLKQGINYYVLLIAVDKEGNRSLERSYESAKIPSSYAGFSSKPIQNEIIDFYRGFVNKQGVGQFIEVTKTGIEPLTVDFIEITGEHTDDFKIIKPEFPFTIENNGDKQSIKMQCFASDLGLRTATLRLKTDDPFLPEVEYPLECEGVPYYVVPLFGTTQFVEYDENDNETYLQHSEKGYSILIDSEGKQTWNMPTKFSGGISVIGNDFTTESKATHFQGVSVKAEIKVDPSHVGQQADLLFIIGMEPQPAPYDEGTDTNYTSVSDSDSAYPLNWHIPPDETQLVKMYTPEEGWEPQSIAAYSYNVTLEDSVQRNFLQETFDKPGMYYFSMGYRLESGDIVYSPEPIKLEVQAGEQPYFPGIVQIVSTNIDTATIAWLPASDNKTLADNITYEVHLSDKPDFEPMPSTLHTSVFGVKQADLESLTTATKYNLLVIAVDEDGNKSKERDYREVTTFSQPPVLSTTVTFAEDKDLGLTGATTQDGVAFTYPASGTQPEIGSVLLANVGEDAYLRKVDSVENTAQGLVVHTSNGELAEIVETGTINTQLTLFDVNAEILRSGSQTRRGSLSNINTIRWENDFLVAKQAYYDNNQSTSRVRKGNQEAEVKASVTFTPELETNLEWNYSLFKGINFTQAKIVASGKFEAELGVFYNFKKEGSKTKEFKIGKPKTFTAKYLLAGVPVYQETTLSIKAQLTATASAEINAQAIAKAIATVRFGVKWNPQTETWDNIADMGFTQSFTADVKVHGKVVGEVRLIPNIETKFYKTLAGNFSIEPFLTGTIAAETIGHANILESWGYLKTQLTRFDADLQAEAFVSASLVFIKEFTLLEKTNIWQSSKWVLFSLPELKLDNASGEVDESIRLSAITKDGVRNDFDDSSIKWDVYPKENVSVSGDKNGTFTASKEGTYTVFFSGSSKIPSPLGRQFAFAEVTVGPKEEEPEPELEVVIPDGGRAVNFGDPHFVTFDRLGYDFQAVGEFILTKSIIMNDNFEIQVRHKAWKDRTDVAITQAAAMNVVGDKVGFYLRQDPFTSINGVQQEIPEGSTALPNGGIIVRNGSRYSIIWPNNHALVKVSEGSRELRVVTYINQVLQGQLIGLLGNADGNRQNELVTQDGTNLGTDTSFESLYPKYADSWRITQEKSLFDYASYEDTEYFTDRDFPQVLSTSDQLDANTRAEAEQICKAANITNPILLENCILDVALTGDADFAQIPPDLADPQERVNVAPPPAPTLDSPGFGQLKGVIYNAVTKQVINGAKVKLTSGGQPIIGVTIKSTVNGIYETDIVPSSYGYLLEIETTGYISEQVFDLRVPYGKALEVKDVYLVPTASQGMGKITGIAKNALEKTNVTDLRVYARRYINNRRSGESEQADVDSNGAFTLNSLSPGNYTISFFGNMKDGFGEEKYVNYHTTAVSIGGQTTNADVAITPEMYDASYYVVLTWSKIPYDLDAHFTGPNYDDSRFHIYFANPGSGRLYNEPYAQLDRDDRDGSGPEILSIGQHLNSNPESLYRFSVHDYKNGGLTSSDVLSKSGARIDIYKDDGTVLSFDVPNQEGTLWTVFELDESNEIVPVNTVGYEVNQGGVRSKTRSARQNSVATDYWPIVFQESKK